MDCSSQAGGGGEVGRPKGTGSISVEVVGCEEEEEEWEMGEKRAPVVGLVRRSGR